MNSLLKSVKSMTNKRHVLVKESLRKQLNTIVMEMQGVEAVNDQPIGNCEEVNALCAVLEAIFLHGLKDSLLNRVTEALSGPDIDAMPQPSFWGPLLVFSHRQIIDQIQGLKQITTEVGYCRAWIRIALNEGLLSSYFTSIYRDNSALKPYYDKSAFLRDPDHLEVAKRLIEGLDVLAFNLASNTSLLNYWSSTPLLMAAIWSPPMKSSPIFSAVDIAKTINSESTENYDFDDVETASSIGSIGSFTSSSILNNVNHLSEDEALKIILATGKQVQDAEGLRKVLKEAQKNERIQNCSTPVDQEQEQADDDKLETSGYDTAGDNENLDTTNVKSECAASLGNSLIGRLGWSTSLDDAESSMTSSIISRGSANAPKTPNEGPTYDALIKSYHTGYATSPDLKDFLDKYAPEKSAEPEEPLKEVEVVIDNLDDQIGKLPREKGLDTQNYSCFDCRHPVGMTFAKAHVCSFTGNYYCTDCMSTEEFLIPARIVHNWDLKHYPVSKKAAEYLTDCAALLDLKTLNPRIYMAVDSMAQLQTLRIQLNLLRAYLFTCREPIIESLQKKVTPREYLYEHVHQYSVADLLDVPSGTLAQQLQRVVEFAKSHVLNCWLCSQKGFICEICSNPKVIYPFDMESTYRCNGCNAVFHSDCLTASKPCPKCERRKKRISRGLESEITFRDTSSAIHIN